MVAKDTYRPTILLPIRELCPPQILCRSNIKLSSVQPYADMAELEPEPKPESVHVGLRCVVGHLITVRLEVPESLNEGMRELA